MNPITATQHAERVRSQQAHDDLYWRDTLSTYAGRTVLWRILEECGLFRDCPHEEPLKVGRFLGGRTVGLNILREIHAKDPTVYVTMQQEEVARQQATTQPTKQPTRKGDDV